MCPRFAIRKGVKVLSRLDIMTPSRAQTVIDGLYRDVERRIAASPPGLCPVDLAMNFLNLCHAQTCGKCVPCRVGLGQLSDLMESVLDGKATMETIALIERTARVIVNSADCAIGRDAARLVLDGIRASATTMKSTFCATAASAGCRILSPAWRCALRAWTFRATPCW